MLSLYSTTGNVRTSLVNLKSLKTETPVQCHSSVKSSSLAPKTHPRSYPPAHTPTASQVSVVQGSLGCLGVKWFDLHLNASISQLSVSSTARATCFTLTLKGRGRGNSTTGPNISKTLVNVYSLFHTFHFETSVYSKHSFTMKS